MQETKAELPMDVGRREMGEKRELRKVVTSEGLGIGEVPPPTAPRIIDLRFLSSTPFLLLLITETAQTISQADPDRFTFL
jgi:hypothetical protein